MGQHRDQIETPHADGAAQVALRELFDRYRAALYAYFLRRTRNAADAEDLTHDVFVRLGRLDPATEIQNAEAFIFQTAANLLRDRARRAEVQRSVVVASSPMPDPPAGDPDAERVLGAKVELSRVMDALSSLSEKTRNIFILRRLEQMKCEEIAAFYGISVSAVEQHITKALAHLAKTVKRPRVRPKQSASRRIWKMWPPIGFAASTRPNATTARPSNAISGNGWIAIRVTPKRLPMSPRLGM